MKTVIKEEGTKGTSKNSIDLPEKNKSNPNSIY